jgi:FkbM family methyltransferase
LVPDGDVNIPRVIEAEISGKGAPSFDGKPTFQFRKFAKAFPMIRDFRHAVDVGAHVGLWSRVLARMFARVTAFEPMPQCRDCFERNIRSEDRARVTLHACALGSTDGELRFKYKLANSGTTHVIPGATAGDATVPVRRLDDFDLGVVDFLKIDVEGYELAVVQGGEQVIRRSRPTIIVEQKPGTPQRYGFDQLGAVRQLQKWGAQLEFEWSGDYCLRWKSDRAIASVCLDVGRPDHLAPLLGFVDD